jgi:thioesterase domain-containing protein/acyl carrier protein
MRQCMDENKTREELRAIIREGWSIALHHDDFLDTDNFYVVGGDSLRFAELHGHVSTVLNKEIPMLELQECVTVEEMMAYLGSVQLPSQDYTFLRALVQRNHSESLIFLHNPYGTSISYAQLAHQIKTNKNIYGIDFNIAGSTWQFPLDQNVILNDYVNEIKQLQPKGPYYLAGDSLGGRLALDVAHILREQGESIGYVFLLDSILNERKDRKTNKFVERFKRYQGFLKNYLNDLKGLSFHEMLKLTQERFSFFLRYRSLRKEKFKSVRNQLDQKINQQIRQFEPGEMMFLSRRVFKRSIQDYYDFACVFLHATRSENLSSYHFIKERVKSIELVSIDCLHGEFISRSSPETARVFEAYLNA